jgi:hypothetical protein
VVDVEIRAVVCMRVDQRGIYVVPGSVQAPCARCGTQVWVARSTFTIVFGAPHIFVCMRCIDESEHGALGEALLRGVEPVQSAELREYHDDIEEHFRG